MTKFNSVRSYHFRNMIHGYDAVEFPPRKILRLYWQIATDRANKHPKV